MPTVLPARKPSQLEPDRAGMLVYVAAVLLMLVISCATLMLRPEIVPTDSNQAQQL